MVLSLEIVPRSYESIATDLAALKQYAAITSINIPDLTRFSLRSWEAAAQLRIKAPEYQYIPHIRACDFEKQEELCSIIPWLRAHSLMNVLVITGDPTPERRSAVQLIKRLKKEVPELHIYAGFDPYRAPIQKELEYLHEKEAAGAVGFFSQPFFDIRLLALYAEYLEGKTIFWGIAPVLSPSSRHYWESRNRAIFPKHFQPTLEWNWSLARTILSFCANHTFHGYLMPINVDVAAYLPGIF
ncbi:MAG: methylenetetrahydrofolate reductase [Treponema sp.]|jgi:methylenetetrahydrofolate reductase (NADPH)|nr:methylenetetrahydrofolate reductase [Treponema sp.]